MDIILIRTLQLILSFSILVLVHELGHFLFARLFRIRVDKFYIFFDPWFSLFKYKPKNSDTEYGIGWLPLGGYCKIAGMVDESMDTEQLAQEPQEWEFRSKPAWQRLLVMIGGVLMNFLLALFIYAMILFTWGEQYTALKDMTNGMYFSKEAKAIGFEDGDILLRADEASLEKFDTDMFRQISEAQKVTVLRSGEEKDIMLPAMNLLSMIKETSIFAVPLVPNVVDTVLADGGFAQAGVMKGDRLIAMNGKMLGSWNEFQEQMELRATQAELDEAPNFTFSLVYSRAGVMDTVQVTTNSDYKVGCSPVIPEYKNTKVEYSFLAAIPAGIQKGMKTMTSYVSDLKYVASKEGAKSVGGFGTIAKLFPATWDWYRFWNMTAFISIMLAVMNLLPIPALDGGHILFLLFEIITGRKLSDKFLTYAQVVGMCLLFGLLIYANGNDIFRAFFK